MIDFLTLKRIYSSLKETLLKVPLKRKLGEEVERARLLENEGFYVGNKPYMTIKNRNMMEDRMLKLPDNVNQFILINQYT